MKTTNTCPDCGAEMYSDTVCKKCNSRIKNHEGSDAFNFEDMEKNIEKLAAEKRNNENIAVSGSFINEKEVDARVVLLKALSTSFGVFIIFSVVVTMLFLYFANLRPGIKDYFMRDQLAIGGSFVVSLIDYSVIAIATWSVAAISRQAYIRTDWKQEPTHAPR